MGKRPVQPTLVIGDSKALASATRVPQGERIRRSDTPLSLIAVAHVRNEQRREGRRFQVTKRYERVRPEIAGLSDRIRKLKGKRLSKDGPPLLIAHLQEHQNAIVSAWATEIPDWNKAFGELGSLPTEVSRSASLKFADVLEELKLGVLPWLSGLLTALQWKKLEKELSHEREKSVALARASIETEIGVFKREVDHLDGCEIAKCLTLKTWPQREAEIKRSNLQAKSQRQLKRVFKGERPPALSCRFIAAYLQKYGNPTRDVQKST